MTIYTFKYTKNKDDILMKDTSLFNEGDGCFEILSHTKIEHDTGQPPPEINILITYQD